MDADSVDTIITDPPYGLSFMGKEWDHGVPGVHFWQEALRVAKPGAMMLAFGGTRTHHRLAVAIEDAGWELRDTIMWVYGSGFPKSHDISKAIDKAAGEEREAVGISSTSCPDFPGPCQGHPSANGSLGGGVMRHAVPTDPATDAARQWHGWGTALKPAWEPILVAMKPLDGTFAQNALRHGVAGLWVDGGRVPTGDNLNGGAYSNGSKNLANATSYATGTSAGEFVAPAGRWPSNLVHDGSDEVLAGFPSNAGGGGNKSRNGNTAHTAVYGTYNAPPPDVRKIDTGSAARFFYCAKASRAERNAGLEGMEERRVHPPGNQWATTSMWNGETGDEEWRKKNPNKPQGNHHPTVKPLALMRYLARLTKTPTGGVVLDPFAGSGSTGCAAVMEGRGFIGIEIDESYADIARARIAKAAEQARQLTLGIEQAA